MRSAHACKPACAQAAQAAAKAAEAEAAAQAEAEAAAAAAAEAKKKAGPFGFFAMTPQVRLRSLVHAWIVAALTLARACMQTWRAGSYTAAHGVLRMQAHTWTPAFCTCRACAAGSQGQGCG